MEPNTQTQIEKVRNAIFDVIRQYLPEGVRYSVNYDPKYDVFDVDLWAKKIREGDREMCAKVAAVAIILSHHNKDGVKSYTCYGYDDVHCHAVVSVKYFSEVWFIPYERIKKVAYEYCDEIFSKVEEKLRKIEEEKRRREEEYRQWRKRNLGDCYAERLDYGVAFVKTAEIGRGVLNVLKPGDRVLVELYTFIDPCFAEAKDGGVYVEGYIPVSHLYCRCREFDAYALVRLPLYIRGRMPLKKEPLIAEDGTIIVIDPEDRHVVAEYKGNGVLEIVQDADKNNYDYYLAVYSFTAHTTDARFYLESVTGAVWHSAYEWGHDVVSDLESGDWQYVSGFDCCEKVPTLIVPMLIRRGEEAKMRFSLLTYKKEEYEATVSTQTFPPNVKLHDITYERERRENLGDCRAELLGHDVYTISYADVGHGVVYVLKPGDRVAVEINTSADPCFLQHDTLYNNIPVFGAKCGCTKRRKEYMIFELPLRIHGSLPSKTSNILIAEYKGDRVLEIVQDADENDYDYYLTTFIYELPNKNAEFGSVEVEGAAWYSAYSLRSFALFYMERDSWERKYTLEGCCNDENPALIIPMLIRRGETAEVRFTVDGKTYTAAVSDRRT